MCIAKRIQDIQTLIDITARQCQRAPNTIKLMAVSKGQPSQAIETAFHAGIVDFGENYLQEAQAKIQGLSHLSLCWHFIGAIQSNKAAPIASLFDWVHSLSRQDIAMQLDHHRPAHLPPLNICLQINLDDEANKSGVAPADAAVLASMVQQLPRLQLRGLMAIPKPRLQAQQQYESFLRLKNLLDDLNTQLHLAMDTLSIGMSDDFLAAIRAGSTLVRIGRAIFGERRGSHDKH